MEEDRFSARSKRLGKEIKDKRTNVFFFIKVESRVRLFVNQDSNKFFADTDTKVQISTTTIISPLLLQH